MFDLLIIPQQLHYVSPRLWWGVDGGGGFTTKPPLQNVNIARLQPYWNKAHNMQQAEKRKHLFLVNKINPLNLVFNTNKGLLRCKYELFVEENLNLLIQQHQILAQYTSRFIVYKMFWFCYWFEILWSLFKMNCLSRKEGALINMRTRQLSNRFKYVSFINISKQNYGMTQYSPQTLLFFTLY